ncbi:alpha/beta hydrolase [Curtobacterium aurantiacum]|uniref:Alpha/beta hydrolase family protein n=1 Tax=Curtobacterium aurantiacum TaxID=3236919 RepID=A0ABS5VGC8_9MICO|nr:alpha/beta hydrolase [Curtobacterium flaccumfaciens]MBT1546046.1 alpha/beta hydrolase family protein [Curtobacterium flaccumfaciens pv. flaccumfaciens]MBT1588162.1 alpha/beta hydrolase family protein [Curtobacterium flaccumfaciens pv. flaccumfaciens]
MGEIQYDDAAADLLAQAASGAAETLRGQSAARRTGVENALDDFDGAYAKRFEESAQIEADDRPKLASVLDELSTQVDATTTAAANERQRQADLAAWQVRQDERDRESAEDPISVLRLPGMQSFDLKPSEIPIAPPSISASFSARTRTRTGGGTSGGTSSADPGHLQSFASGSRALDRAASTKQTTLRNAWTGFTASCGWAKIDGSTFLHGFERLLEENDADAAWADRIADAFEQAGGHGSISNATLDVSAAAELPPAFQQMLDPDLSAAEVAALWAGLGYSAADANDLRALPLPVLSVLGNLEGVDYWARDTANRVVLDARIRAAEQEVEDLRSTVAYDNGTSWMLASENLEALRAIDTASQFEQGSKAGERFIVSLTDDVPPLAAVSVGDLDTADNVTWAVPGMGSDTTGMVGWTDSAQHLYDQQADTGPEDRAVISWMGYKTPPQPVVSGKLDFGVLGSDYAETGGDQLAASIRGLDAVRQDDGPTTNVVAHSYGSTTSAYALTQSGVQVDSFTTIGSAGLPNSIEDADDLNADHVYAGQARDVWAIDPEKGDQWAWTGRLSPVHSQDPTDPDFGATAFGADGSGALNPVEDHGTHTEDERGYLDPNTESLTNIGFATTGHPELMTEAQPKGPTQFQESLLENPQWTL